MKTDTISCINSQFYPYHDHIMSDLFHIDTQMKMEQLNNVWVNGDAKA